MKSISKLITTSAVALSAILLAGCASSSSGSGEYHPDASPTQLSAYAATSPYPSNMQSQENAHLVALVNRGNGQITLHNFGDQGLKDFKLWVNQSYVVSVNRLDAGGYRIFNLGDLYNTSGSSMDGTSADNIKKVQVQMKDGVLYDAMGPRFE